MSTNISYHTAGSNADLSFPNSRGIDRNSMHEAGGLLPIKVPKKVEYEPVPVRELLIEMKDYASLMLDLAYFSVIYGDTRIAFEVLSLEDHIDRLWSLLVMQASLAVRDADDAESMVSVYRVANALDTISDAAADLAELVVRGIDIHESIRAGLLAGEEIIARLEVAEGSRLDGSRIESVVGDRGAASILLLRRKNGRMIFMPSPEVRLEKGDIIVVRGTEDVLEDIAIAAGDKLPRPMVKGGGEKEIAEKITFLKNLSEVMVDLAFHSVIWSDGSAAMEVLELEETMDDEVQRYYELAINKLRDKPEATAACFLGIIRLGEAFEVVGDAATEMANILVAGLPIHEVIEAAEEESVEQVLKAVVRRGSLRLSSLGLEDMGAIPVAVKHRGKWIPQPDGNLVLKEGDEIVLKYYVEAEESLLERLSAIGIEVIEDEEE